MAQVDSKLAGKLSAGDYPTCSDCGVLVGDKAQHEAFHVRLNRLDEFAHRPAPLLGESPHLDVIRWLGQ